MRTRSDRDVYPILNHTITPDFVRLFKIIMDNLDHSSFPPTALGRQDDEEVTPGLRPLQYVQSKTFPEEEDLNYSNTLAFRYVMLVDG
ncbi:hypothetical protein TNCV_3506281 [Trichonephila clavipes]|uniref:Uncharacterized protein n=1 Tax=Trichonephila clavipes TaxID=2585209 RepID=A0A8X6S946_TRICX|nr:hypothetical protein TNCV_3506281 [Trichonephila clavipes]